MSMVTVQGPNSERETRLNRMMLTHERELMRLCCLYLHDAALAQDAVQETFLKAFRKLDGFREQASERTWLIRIAVNTCRDMCRNAWFRHVDRRVEADALPTPADFSFPDNTVLRTVMALPPRYREVVLLRYYQNMKQKEVAAVLGISERAVRQRLKKANQILREELKEWYEDEG